MDKLTKSIIKKYSPMWTVKETYEYEQKYGEPHFDVKYVHEQDEKTIWGNKKLEFSNMTLRELWNNTYDNLYGRYEMWIKDVPIFENDPPSITDDHIRYALSMTVEDMVEDEQELKFRQSGGWLVIACVHTNNLKQAKKFYEEFYHFIVGFGFKGNLLNNLPESESESDEYLEKLSDEFYKKMKRKLGDRYIPGNKEKPDNEKYS
mgnify:FL=1